MTKRSSLGQSLYFISPKIPKPTNLQYSADCVNRKYSNPNRRKSTVQNCEDESLMVEVNRMHHSKSVGGHHSAWRN
jgi:hypothetical protein